ncbi:MAG: DUF2007 domain-containing protein [Alphaproteobacteria bacterium]|nr:MAG: DUF2007 domain-containing protein [Alphaproteobacteria bacterium]
MRLLIRSNDPVVLSLATSILAERGIKAATLDTHMSVLDGSIGALPRRLVVADEDWAAACRLLREAGLAHELVDES